MLRMHMTLLQLKPFFEGWHDLSISAFPFYPPFFHLSCGLHLACLLPSRISHLVDPIFPIRWHPAGISSLEPFASAILFISSISSTPSRHISILDRHLVHLICLVAI